MRLCIVTRDLNTMTQLCCWVRSMSRSASWGMDTFGSFVHCNRSENTQRKQPLFTCKIQISSYY